MIDLVPKDPANSRSAIEIAADHSLRSEHVRQLLLRSGDDYPAEAHAETPPIPAKILQYWDAEDCVPLDVQGCIDSWVAVDPGRFTHTLFNRQSADRYIAANFGQRHIDAFRNATHPAMRCDYFRLCFLLRDGGFYVDADDYCNTEELDGLFSDRLLKLQPFCFDLVSGEMVDDAKSVASDINPHAKVFYSNNNPIVAPPGHSIIRFALDRATTSILRDPLSRDIQSVSGPGCLTESLVEHSIDLQRQSLPLDFVLLTEFGEIVQTKWDLGYRNDDRNWRTWAKSEQ